MDRCVRILLTAVLTVTGVLTVLPASYVAAGGWVANQSFEQQGEDDAPYGWDLTGNPARVSTGPIYAGSWAAVIDEEGETLTQWIEAVEAVLSYEIWGWMHVSGNVTGVITVDFWEGQEGRQLSATRMLFTGDTGGSWVQESDTIEAPPGTTYLRIRLLGTGWGEGDEVRFDEIGVYTPGGGFWDWLRERCFIATAAYGTETARELDMLRDFRDQVLLENGAGSSLVDAYYRLSPPVAHFIAKNDFIRAIVRDVLIDPLVHLLQWSQILWRV
jgi:hypothetical protein